jgi:hypothetical protein
MSAASDAADQFLANFVGGQQFNPNLGMDQQIAYDMNIMRNPINNMVRRARDYSFHEPGNVGANKARGARELEAAQMLTPGYYQQPTMAW